MMRASDRDRERAVALLRARCVEGVPERRHLRAPLGRVAERRSLAELRVLVADVARAAGAPWPRLRAAG